MNLTRSDQYVPLRIIDEHEGERVSFSGLDQRQGFHGLVERSESAGKERNGIGFLQKSDLPVEKVFVRDETRDCLR